MSDTTTAVPIDEVARSLDDMLRVDAFDEPDSNGLLVRAADRVALIAVSANTSYHVIRTAAAAGADLLLTHHPSWERLDLEHAERKRALLVELGLSHYSAHSPLDGAEGFSNSDLLAGALGVRVQRRFHAYCGGEAGVIGEAEATSFEELVDRLRRACGPGVSAWRNADRFGRVAIVTGGAGAATAVAEAAQLGADTYVTGEGSMWTKLYARESGVNLAFGTHYATETYGVRELGRRIAERFGISWTFVAEQDDIR